VLWKAIGEMAQEIEWLHCK